MANDKPGRGTVERIRRGARAVVSRQSVGMALLGLLAGASLGLLDQQSVVLPILGGVPGWLVGVAGIVLSAVASTRLGGCDGCGDSDCGCDGESAADPDYG